jgi:hypothetical protein
LLAAPPPAVAAAPDIFTSYSGVGDYAHANGKTWPVLEGAHRIRDVCRWGHARLIEPPGFRYCVAGMPSPREWVRQGCGRIAIGHSELNRAQHWDTALEYGKKALGVLRGSADRHPLLPLITCATRQAHQLSRCLPRA